MAQEIFTRWDPWWWYRDVPTTNIASIYDDWEGFRLILTGSNCPPTRVFVAGGHLAMYRVYDEIGYLGLNPHGLHPGHSFYKSDSSGLLAESSKMNNVLYSAAGPPLHYAIYTEGRCVDIICTKEPRFVLLGEFASGRYASERPEPTES